MVRLVIWMSMYLRRSGSHTRLRFIPSGVNEAAFELHAQLPPAGSISQSRGAVVDPSSASFEVAAVRGGAGAAGWGPWMRTWPIGTRRQPWQPRRALPRRWQERERNKAATVLQRGSYWDTARWLWRAKAYLRVKR
jgi:hypothetical protein